MEKLLDLLLSLANLLDARSSDPVLAALKRAERGAVLAIFCAGLAIGGMFAFAPDHDVPPSGSPLALAWVVQHWLSVGCAVLTLVASCIGLYQIGRYIAVAKWPERFVDFNQQSER